MPNGAPHTAGIYNPGSMTSPFALPGNPLINHAGSMLNPMAHAPHHHSMGPDLTPTPAVAAGADDWYSKSLNAFKMSHVAAAAASTTSPQSHAHLQHPGLMPY